MGSMLPYIAAPWILWVRDITRDIKSPFNIYPKNGLVDSRTLGPEIWRPYIVEDKISRHSMSQPTIYSNHVCLQYSASVQSLVHEPIQLTNMSTINPCVRLLTHQLHTAYLSS